MKNFFGVRFDADCDDYVVVDIETTGLNAKTCEIIEIAALKVKNGNVIDEFQTFVKPTKPISTELSKINGITRDMVEEAPDIEKAVSLFLDFLDDNIILGHNLEWFVFKFLSVALGKLNKVITNDYIDIYFFADDCLWGKVPDYRLSTLINYFMIYVDDKERAMKDCCLINLCYRKLIDIYRTEWDKEDYYEEYIEKFNTLVTKQTKPINVSVIRNALEHINDGAQYDPILRCLVLLPLIKYEIENDCFETFLEEELLGFRKDIGRGMYKRLTKPDYNQIKADIEYCIDWLSK